MDCGTPVVAAAAEAPDENYPFRWVIGLIIVLIVIEFLCGIVTGGRCGSGLGVGYGY